MENDSESEKPGVIIFGQKFCDKLEHIPIKKRILLRDSAVYQRTPSSADAVDKKPGSLPVSPSVVQHSDPNFSSMQQVENDKSGQLNDISREVSVLKDNKDDSHSDFSGVKIDNANKVLRTEAVSPRTISKLTLVSSFGPVARDDGLCIKSAESVPGLIDNVIKDVVSDEKSIIQLDLASCKDLEAMHSMTPDNRILWDLNVAMDAWEKPYNHLNVESKSDVTTSDVQSGSNLERSEDFSMKVESLVSENDTESKLQPTFESVISGASCKSVKGNQQVVPGSFSDKARSITEASLETVKSDKHLASILVESVSELLTSAPRKVSGSSFETPNYSDVSTEEQNCENKNIIIEGGGSANIPQVCDDEGNGSSKKRGTTKAEQHNVIDLNSCGGILEQRVHVKEGDRLTVNEKVTGETVKAPTFMRQSKQVTENSPKHVDIDMGNQLRTRFQEGCDGSAVEPLRVPAKCNHDATIIKQVTNMDRDNATQTEQDYEDGELRDLDMDCWNENETEMGETDFGYKPLTGNIGDMDKSRTSVLVVVKDESGLNSRKCRLSETLTKDRLLRKDGSNAGEKLNSGSKCSENGTHIMNTQLEKKLSGWDQLPKDGNASSEKVQDARGNLSRTSRSELQSSIDVPTLSEDAEEKETVVERRIRPRDMDESYPADSASGFDKFSGNRRSTIRMHERNRAEGWETERRSSVNYHDLYDNHSGSRRMIAYKGRECPRSRSPSDRSEAYDPYINYSRYSRGRRGGRSEGSGRSFRGARNGYRDSLTDDRSESESCVRQQFLRRDRSLSPRATRHFSESFNRSRSKSRTRSPPSWLPPYERLGSRGHRRSPEFNADDRAKRTRLPFWKSNFTPDTEMRYTSPTRGGFIPQGKSRWNNDEEFDIGGIRERSPVTSFRQKGRFEATSSRGRIKSSEDFRPIGYRGRVRETTSPDRVRTYNDGKDKRKHEDSFETGHQKQYYKDGFSRRYRHNDEVGAVPQKFPLKEEHVKDGETRSLCMRTKESRKS